MAMLADELGMEKRGRELENAYRRCALSHRTITNDFDALKPVIAAVRKMGNMDLIDHLKDAYGINAVRNPDSVVEYRNLVSLLNRARNCWDLDALSEAIAILDAWRHQQDGMASRTIS